MSAAADYRTLTAECEVIVCCGTGGVGKTTTAAATAMAAAAMGRRAAVVTIDPAKRLADALGIRSLDNDPTIIEGPWPGTLAALMLDTKATFDNVVRRHAPTGEQAETILGNRFYHNISTSLSGTQDYMAVEKLAELHSSGDWDLVVVDTPPTRDALAFLEAPKLLTRLLDNPIYKIAEHFFVGLAAGYYLALEARQVFWPNLLGPLLTQGRLLNLIPLALVLLLFTRLVPRVAWLSRCQTRSTT